MTTYGESPNGPLNPSPGNLAVWSRGPPAVTITEEESPVESQDPSPREVGEYTQPQSPRGVAALIRETCSELSSALDDCCKELREKDGKIRDDAKAVPAILALLETMPFVLHVP